MDRKFRVLFISNSIAGRTVMAEALLRHLGGDRFEASSEGLRSDHAIHPITYEALARLGVPADSVTRMPASGPADFTITLVEPGATLETDRAVADVWEVPCFDNAPVAGAPAEMRSMLALSILAFNIERMVAMSDAELEAVLVGDGRLNVATPPVAA